MQHVSFRPGYLSIVFILGAAIGAIYTPLIITSADIEDDMNLEKQEPQNKSTPFNEKTNRKKQFAQIGITARSSV